MEAPGGQRHTSEQPNDEAQEWEMTEMAARKIQIQKVHRDTTVDRYGLMLRIAFVSLEIFGDKST